MNEHHPHEQQHQSVVEKKITVWFQGINGLGTMRNSKKYLTRKRI
jgi:hypothetical protein